MKPEDLRDEVAIELEQMEATVKELLSLVKDISGREPTVREKTAAAAFLAQFYNGVENILKRICNYHNHPLPAGDTWHIELFKLFCAPPHPSLPVLFDETLATTLAPYRRFRHVAFHGYGVQLEWSRMAEGVRKVENIFSQFRKSLADYLTTIET